MYSSSDGRKSFDSLASPTSVIHRPDFPFHRQQQSSNSYVKQRRGSTASSIVSIGGSLDTVLGSWPDSVPEAGQNAISTLLQPPIVRTGLLPHTAAPASSTHKPPTARDIPPVTLTNIPHVETSEFAQYLTQVGALHEQLRRVKESEEEQAATVPRRNSSKDDLNEAGNGNGTDGLLRPGGKRLSSSSRKPSFSSVSSLNLNEPQSPSRRGSGGLGRRLNQGPPPLSTIPNVYFDEDFHLENPRTFDIVSERSEVVPSGEKEKSGSSNVGGISNNSNAPRKALATNAILQEKLSWYMDTVEMHLIASISTASTAFFTALGSLKELHTEATESVDRIKALRTELSELDEEIAVQGLAVVRKKRRQQNVEQFHAAVMQLGDIVDGVVACEQLVDEGAVDQALDKIDALEKLIAGEETKSKAARKKYPLRDLRGATALQGVNDDIATLRQRIGKAYEAKFVSTLMADIRHHTETVSKQEVLMRWNSASVRARGGHSRDPSTFPSYLAATDALRTELLPLLTGLYRARHLAMAVQVFRDNVLREVKNLVRRPLPSSNDDDNESMMSTSTMGTGSGRGGGRHRSQHEKSSILARNLRSLDPEDAEALLFQIYISVTETLRRLTTEAKLLLDVASSVGENVSINSSSSTSTSKNNKNNHPMSPPFSPSGRAMEPPMSSAGMEAQGQVHLTLDLNNLVGQAVDVAQDKIVKLLRVRAEQSAHQPFVWFLRYFTLNLHFANECEAISGRSGTALKTVVNGQVRDFVTFDGNAEAQQLAQDMEQDQWSAKDFTEKNQALLQQILDASTRDVDAWTEGVKLWKAVGEDGEGGTAAGDATTTSTGKSKTRSAIIDSESFLLPTSAVLCVEGVARFLHLMAAIPFMTADVATTLVQYLQVFNSRCTQLILGAGAVRSAGLKNITTRHLAVASQALAFVAALVPYVREFVRRRANNSAPGGATSGLMGEFDKVRRLYQEHQNNIYDKLVEIMSGRAQSHAKAMRTIDWDVVSGSVDIHPYMETLVKETATLHRNLAKTLPEGTVRFIMVSVFAGYREQLGSVFRSADARTMTGRDSMLRDIACFEARLNKIDGFDDSGVYLKEIVEAKEIKAPTPPPPPPPEPKPAEPEPKPASPPPVAAAAVEEKPPPPPKDEKKSTEKVQDEKAEDDAKETEVKDKAKTEAAKTEEAPEASTKGNVPEEKEKAEDKPEEEAAQHDPEPLPKAKEEDTPKEAPNPKQEVAADEDKETVAPATAAGPAPATEDAKAEDKPVEKPAEIPDKSDKEDDEDQDPQDDQPEESEGKPEDKAEEPEDKPDKPEAKPQAKPEETPEEPKEPEEPEEPEEKPEDKDPKPQSSPSKKSNNKRGGKGKKGKKGK